MPIFFKKERTRDIYERFLEQKTVGTFENESTFETVRTFEKGMYVVGRSV